ncbi:hypothetical protein AMTR_s00080p00058830 [Amborella trichopoda]|uniref:Uncharacterized protein n=1 Tax=Amborella trichopoda TaxID=13333 RepID=W1PCX9_AMBTC|nr:hypothetical protein AMTR_s00080p00058830 [Amborella trichopoda]
MVDGSHDQQYKNIPLYFEKLQATNTRTEVCIHTSRTCRLKCLFVAFHPCVMGFVKGCKPLIRPDGTFLEIQIADLDAYEWMRWHNPKYWANARFHEARYNHLTSNMAKSFNKWILLAQDQPIITLLNT